VRPFPVLPFGALWYVEPNATVVIAVAALILAGLHAVADPNARFFRAGLDGYHEAPLSISTNGTGSFQAVLNPTGDQLTYERQFSGLEGGNTLFAHVHIGQPGTTGGVMFFLCGGGGKTCTPENPGNGHRNRECERHYWAIRSRRCRRRVPGGH
jgi:hypothetical protein